MLVQISEHFGELPNCLVNNASQFFDDQPDNATPASLVSHFRINAAAPASLALQLAKSACAERPLAVVNILDQRISHPSGDQFSYTTSKLALAGLTEQLARALAPHVRVCAVAPGLTLATPDYDEPQLDRLRQMMPLKLLPQPSDIADAVVYLVNARATTGQTIFVDGGADLKSWDRDFVYLGR
jgi:NAD(P)-dependent dehydrogenase (short-subunit alcohol dehydrogenase family)